MARPAIRLAVAALLGFWSSWALAQAPSPRVAQRCDVLFDPIYVSQAYNPLAPDDYVASFTATGRRSGENSTADYSAVLIPVSSSKAARELWVISDDGAGGAGNVVYEKPGPELHPSLDDSARLIFCSIRPSLRPSHAISTCSCTSLLEPRSARALSRSSST